MKCRRCGRWSYSQKWTTTHMMVTCIECGTTRNLVERSVDDPHRPSIQPAEIVKPGPPDLAGGESDPVDR